MTTDRMALLQAVVDIVAATAWPVALVFVATRYKEEFQSLLTRVRKASLTGVEFDAGNQQGVRRPDDDLALTDYSRSTPAVRSLEETLSLEINKRPSEQRQAVLVHELAISRLVAHFERSYRLIFGSQIRALRLLDKDEGGVPTEEAFTFFEQVKLGNPEFYENRSFHEWSRFLIDGTGFVARRDGNYVLTDLGREFLSFLREMDYPEDKPL